MNTKRREKLTQEEWLVVLIEEAAEVIQAATKCLRFGYARDWPGYGRNDLALAIEVGQLAAACEQLNLDEKELTKGYNEKIQKVEEYKAYMLDNPVCESHTKFGE